MRRKGAQFLSRAHVPEDDCFVVRAADEDVAFGGEGEGVDVMVVAVEGARVGFSLGDTNGGLAEDLDGL